MSILLLFGAGASYGSGGINNQPPLGADLFAALCKEYPDSWGNSLAPPQISAFKEDFEDGMDKLYNAGEANVAPLLRHMAIYFSKFQINKPTDNLYCLLAQMYRNEINNKKIILATLNYECLIENALAEVGLKTTQYRGSEKGPKLLKPHGSCNFLPLGFTGNSQNFTLKMQGGTINCNIEAVDPKQVENRMQDIPIPVCMSLFTKGKPNPISPNFIEEIRNEFKHHVQKSKTLISIGVRPNPLDAHIWGPISNSRGKIFLVADDQSCQTWIAQNKKSKAQQIGRYFDEAFGEIVEKISG